MICGPTCKSRGDSNVLTILPCLEKKSANDEAKIIASNRALIKINERAIPRLIGRRGERIARLEKSLGLKLDVEPRDMINEESLIPFQLKESKSSFIFIHLEYKYK